VDIHIKNMAMFKQKVISLFEIILKRVAVDCELFKAGNENNNKPIRCISSNNINNNNVVNNTNNIMNISLVLQQKKKVNHINNQQFNKKVVIPIGKKIQFGKTNKLAKLATKKEGDNFTVNKKVFKIGKKRCTTYLKKQLKDIAKQLGYTNKDLDRKKKPMLCDMIKEKALKKN
jgi:hypothetical protein